MLTDDLRARAQARLIECYGLTWGRLKRAYPIPTLRFDREGWRVKRGDNSWLGMANALENWICINPVLYPLNVDRVLAEVIPHECAHLIAPMVWGPKLGGGHGRGWQHIMRTVFDIQNPERCADARMIDRGNYKPRVYQREAFACKCRTHMLTRRTGNKIDAGTRYRCRICKTPLVRSSGDTDRSSDHA